MGASKGSSSSQSVTDIWNQQKPFLQDLYSQAQGALPGAQATAGQLTGAAMPAWQQAMNPQGNPYLQGMAQAGLGDISRQLTQNILPGIEGEAMGGMNLGSSRQGIAQGLAAQGAQMASRDFLSNLYGNQYQQDMNRSLSAVGMAPLFQQMQFAPLKQYQQIIGAPTKVGSSSSDSKSMGLSL